MKQHVSVTALALISIALGIALFATRQENGKLKKQLADLSISETKEIVAVADSLTPIESAASNPPEVHTAPIEEAVIPVVPPEDNAGRRMMSSMAKMMENPTMNKIMEASQRGAIGALYSDMIEYLDLNAEETKYFMDLLMHRQMKQVDIAMKMMGGNLSEEEQKQLTAELEEATNLVKSEMKIFLNGDKDYEEFEFYEKTMGERMMLSQLDQNLSGSEAALSDEAYRSLLGMMHDERSSFTFSSNLHDENNNDVNPARFSEDNVKKFDSDMNALNERILEQAKSMLTLEQLKAFESVIKASAELQIAQIEMASQMFSGKEN
ncbi:MAG: hypothetical protein V3V05_09270 [Pontiella sp.]